MSKVSIQGDQNGTGDFTIKAPNSNTDRTLTLPDEAGSVLTDVSDISAANLAGDVAAERITGALNATGSAPVYACRAWVNFNGTGTVSIRDSGNVSSITDNGTGDYTVNFATAMPDANYCVSGSGARQATPANNNIDIASLNIEATDKVLTTSVTVVPSTSNSGGDTNVVRAVDYDTVTVAIFR